MRLSRVSFLTGTGSLADAQLSAPMSTSAFIQIQLSVVEQEKRLKEGTFK